MGLPDRETLSRCYFVASVAIFAFSYGVLAQDRGWFPVPLAREAGEQLLVLQDIFIDDDHPATEPRRYDRQGARTLDPEVVQPGLTLIPSIWEDFGWQAGVQLIDLDGRVVHAWETNPAEIFTSKFKSPLAELSLFSQPDGVHLFPNGDLIVQFGGVGTARLNACGDVLWTIVADHHHSIARSEDGSFWVSGRDPVDHPDPFTEADTVQHDQLVRISADGNVLRRIAIFEILARNEPLLRRYVRFDTEDTHLNDVEALPASMADEYPMFEAGDLLASLRHLNLVFVVDPESLAVRWWTGTPFVFQHDPDFVGDGRIGVFDNQTDHTEHGTRLGGSRIVGFIPHTDSAFVWFEPPADDPFYTEVRGDWQLLPNGNALMTESMSGRVVEVTPEGRLAWEWVHPPYDDARVPVVYWVERYPFSTDDVAEWPCGPERDGSSFGSDG